MKAVEPGFDNFTYTQSPRLIWTTKLDLLGADYGAALRVPFGYKEVTLRTPVVPPGSMFPPPQGGPTTSLTLNQFGLEDIEIQPLILSWQLKHFDITAGYSVWAPTGDHDVNTVYLIRLGQDCWTHMFTLGGTWYPDTDKTWAFSVLTRYEISTEQFLQSVPTSSTTSTSQYDTPGDTFTLEWAASKTIVDHVNVGLSGYYQQQVTDTETPASISNSYLNHLVDVAGIGPEIGVTIPQWGLAASLRYAYEFTSNDRPEGNQITLTLRKTF